MSETAVEVSVHERLRAAKELNENLRRERALRQNYGINFYRPHLKQYKFHISPATGRYMRFGNRGGKSDCGIIEDLCMCMGQRPFMKKVFPVLQGDRTVAFYHEGHETHPYVTAGIPQKPVKGLVIVVDWDVAQRVFFTRTGSDDAIGKFWRYIPREAVGKTRVDGKGRFVEIEIKRERQYGGGSSTLTIETVQSYKNNKLSLESADWDFIHVDEPCPQAMFEAVSRGLMDRAGRYWFNCTPLDEMWINDEFTPPKCRVGFDAPDGTAFGKPTSSGHQTTRFVITGSIYDNPHRNDAGVAEFESTLTRDQKACRLYGIPTAMAGLVYKSFEYDSHVLEQVPFGWNSFKEPPADYTIRWWFDYHTRLPQAVLFFATDPKGRVFVYDELFEDNHIDPVCKKILARTQGRNVIDQEIDPFALIPHPVTGESVQDELAKYGLFPVPSTKDLTTGIIKTDQRLAERDPQGQPTIYFAPHLTQTLYEFQHYVYDSEKNEPKDKDNHMMENLYRAILNGCPYVDPSPTKFVRRVTAIRPDEHTRGFKQPTNYK